MPVVNATQHAVMQSDTALTLTGYTLVSFTVQHAAGQRLLTSVEAASRASRCQTGLPLSSIRCFQVPDRLCDSAAGRGMISESGGSQASGACLWSSKAKTRCKTDSPELEPSLDAAEGSTSGGISAGNPSLSRSCLRAWSNVALRSDMLCRARCSYTTVCNLQDLLFN